MLAEKLLQGLKEEIEGDVYWDALHKAIYATDGSVYRKIPAAIVHPKNAEDIRKVVLFALAHETNIIPRTAGTSLAGQCVGEGIVLDTSRYMNHILEINRREKWVRVQPGVVRDRLNQVLASENLFFPPETATASRAMIGGMVGNNSCGANSIVYGSTRDYVQELQVVLSDGSMASIKSTPAAEIDSPNPFLSKIKGHVLSTLAAEGASTEIRKEFPKRSIHRRNTGYAVDLVLDQLDLGLFDLTKLICGSEGTLAITTEIKLKLVDPPGKASVMICPHFSSIDESMMAVVTIMNHAPYTCELMDRFILKCTDGNEVFRQYKFFVQGDPAAILMVEFRHDDPAIAQAKIQAVETDLKAMGLGYAYPMIEEKNIKKVWDLRRAGLGLLANLEGNKKAIECIEDTAVALEDLPQYIKEFTAMMDTYHQKPLYYAHAGAGELHLRPVLNMHDPADRKDFRSICEDSARLVKKFDGSLSGEHGDGRLRGELIPLMIGEKNYQLLRKIKQIWDPQNIFNPGKIVDAYKLDEDLRYDHEKAGPEVATVFDFSETGGFYHSAARCSGSADCRKQASLGGTMCPSFMATLDEKDSTRARANALREFYSDQALSSIKEMKEVKEILDQCLSCKGCHNECPSKVDMTILKAEFMNQYHQRQGLPFRTSLFGQIDAINQYASILPAFSNWAQNLSFVKKMIGIHQDRTLPNLYHHTFRSWTNKFESNKNNSKRPVLFFVDEFTNHYDVAIGIKAVELLDKLGYPIHFTDHGSSGRAQLSKGMLDQAQQLAQKNTEIFQKYIPKYAIVGIEPSAILTLKDEYPKLLRNDAQEQAKIIALHTFTLEEFLYQEINKGNIIADQFDTTERDIKIHGHCHQKALTDTEQALHVLGLPVGHRISMIQSGCCGMAGSFGYEKEHYDLSMKIGELVLFPAIRASNASTIIVASGTSCRHQISDGTKRLALHPAEILWSALRK